MSLGKTADLLMYAPFVNIFEVPDQIHKKLTVDKFFEKNGCYVHPGFENPIKMSETIITDDMENDDWPIGIYEISESLETSKKDFQAFENWIESSGEGIFTFLGDPGTGKTTFLHYLKWSREDIQWHILDLKKSVREIKIYDSRIVIPYNYFYSFHGKVLSSIFLEIQALLFVNKKEKNAHSRNREKIQSLIQCYENQIVNDVPLEEYAELYIQLAKIEIHENDKNSDLNYCKACAKVITKYFEEKCFNATRNRDTDALALRCALTHLLILLKCFCCKNNKNIIVFDNIERFIGADEVYNKELTDFLNDMRNFCDNYREEYTHSESNTNLFSRKYQFIISMRNTTVRNYTPAESTDSKRHIIDLSNWFSIGEIIQKKLDWYDKEGIKVINDKSQKRLKYILSDNIYTKNGTIRGLKPKLDLFFNHNKRLIISFLIEMFESPALFPLLKTADDFYEMISANDNNISCLRFGYRAIIWRNVLEWLKKGELFKKEILGEYKTKTGQISAINYIWKLLVVLHNFSTANGGKETKSSGTEKYMPILDLIKQVYNEHNDFTTRFYEKGFDKERERMARLLFYMNYYNRSENNWFQFIDIQYNVDSANRKRLNTWEDLNDVFIDTKENPKNLKVRITTAGKAYLAYVAPSFEFISCIADKPSILCCLPTEKELKEYNVKDLKCIKIIYETTDLISLHIKDFQPQMTNPNLMYRRMVDLQGKSYKEYLIKSTYGYLTNFIDCINRLVVVTDETAQKNKDDLTKLIASEAENLWVTYLPNEFYK